MPTPLVSVIVPAYNVERYLPDALRSVVEQTWTQLEILVVDDGSTDGTGALADRFAAGEPRARVIHKSNGGLSSARNAGLGEARGELICFLDADDILLPDKLERQARFLAMSPGCDLVYSDHYFSDVALTPRSLFVANPPLPIAELLSFRNWFGAMSPLLRASLVARVGAFDEALTSSEDWDYWIRASQYGTLSYLPGPVAVCRAHPDQMSRNWERMRTNIERVIRKHRTPGSEAWGNSQAMLALMIAKRRWDERRFVATTRHFLEYAWQLRSRRRRTSMAKAFSQ